MNDTMEKKSNIYLYFLILLGIQACKPDEVGFLNDNLRYNVAEIQVNQGSVVYTDALIANGSTTPLNVSLLAIRNKRTGALAPEFLEEHELSTYLSEITWRDTTLEQLYSKIGKAMYPPFMLNSIGGRIGFTQATTFVDTGLYTIDIEVSNIAGKRTYNEALDFRIIGTKSDSIFYQACTSSDYGVEDNFITYPNFEIDIEHIPDGENKIIYMWLDKDGKPFNPAAGEVIRRGDRPTFKNWSPYYPEVVTDTALVYEYPDVSGLTYPIMNGTYVNGEYWSGDPISYYRVVGTANDLRRNLNPVSTIKFYLPGTYIVRCKFLTVSHATITETKVTVPYDVDLPEGAGYTATPVNVDQQDLEEIFGLTAGQISSLIGSSIKFYGVESNGILNPMNTATEPGHWFDANGNVTNWGDEARLYSEYDVSGFMFNIGQYPDKNVAGDTYTIRQALVYDKGNEGLIQVTFVFNITIK